MLNSHIVKNPVDKYWLFGVTAIFLLLGVFVVYISIDRFKGVYACEVNGEKYEVGSEVPGYKEGFVCRCEGGEVMCTKTNVINSKPTLDKFTREKVKVTPKYLIAGTTDILSNLPLKTQFKTISTKNSIMDVTIEQEQMCTSDGRVPIQVGMYNLSGNKLYITNIINKNPAQYTEPCTVQVNYKISDWKYNKDDLTIVYMAEDGNEYNASTCFYNQNIYANGDVYSAEDSCNLCKCNAGTSKCTNDRVCTSATK